MNQFKLKTSRKTTDHYKGIYGNIPQIDEEILDDQSMLLVGLPSKDNKSLLS
jgi:hypothetical protein